MKIVGNTVGTSLPKSNLMQEDPKKGDFVKGKEEFLGKISGSGVFIAAVRVDRGRYSFINGSHAELLEAYGKQAAVMLNVNGFPYYLANVDGDNILHFGQIPYSNSDSETANIPNYYLMVAPDNSITQTVRHIATEGFVNDAIQQKIPDDLAPPTVTMEQTEDGAVISITDKNGTTTATIGNGKDGVDGNTPVKGVDYFTESEIEEVAAMAAAMVPGGGGRAWEIVAESGTFSGVTLVELDCDFSKFSEFVIELNLSASKDQSHVCACIVKNGEYKAITGGITVRQMGPRPGWIYINVDVFICLYANATDWTASPKGVTSSTATATYMDGVAETKIVIMAVDNANGSSNPSTTNTISGDVTIKGVRK